MPNAPKERPNTPRADAAELLLDRMTPGTERTQVLAVLNIVRLLEVENAELRTSLTLARSFVRDEFGDDNWRMAELNKGVHGRRR
jgi:hypothetical protein